LTYAQNPTTLCAVRTTVVLDDALFHEATKVVLEAWLSKKEPPPRRWKTLVIEQGLSALLADDNLSRKFRDGGAGKPKTLTIIVDEHLLRRAEAAVAKELRAERERTRMAGVVINHGLRALLRQRASRRLAATGGEVEAGPGARRARGA
jgi:hypothetical protein